MRQQGIDSSHQAHISATPAARLSPHPPWMITGGAPSPPPLPGRRITMLPTPSCEQGQHRRQVNLRLSCEAACDTAYECGTPAAGCAAG
jgi:hypothetical protein